MTISPTWAFVAAHWLGLPDGRHCHWCAHVKHDDGCSYCGNPESKFHDGDRIRTWDGAGCAAECAVFKLDPYYEDEANIDKSFSPEAAAEWRADAAKSNPEAPT